MTDTPTTYAEHIAGNDRERERRERIAAKLARLEREHSSEQPPASYAEYASDTHS